MRGSELARLVLSRHWEGRGPGAHREAKSITIYARRKNLHGQKRSDRGRRACAASCPPVHDRAGGGERVATVAATQTRRRPRTHCRRCTWAGSVTSTMTRPCLEWGALLSIERPAMELRADASRKDHCPQPSTSACPMVSRTADATLTRGRVQRRVGWDAPLLPRPLPFLGFASCLLPNALAGFFEHTTPFYAAFIMSTCARLRCPQTCGSGSRCGCVSYCYGIAGAH